MAAAVVWVPALAAETVERHYSPAYAACLDRAGGVTPEMRFCISAEQERWEAQLNGAYRQAMASLPLARQAGLRGEERSWLRRREHVCASAGDDEAGGTLQPVEIDQCYLDETIRRTLRLRAYR